MIQHTLQHCVQPEENKSVGWIWLAGQPASEFWVVADFYLTSEARGVSGAGLRAHMYPSSLFCPDRPTAKLI